MSIYPKILESKMKVRFHDCDPYNHLNNSRYIDYIVTARGDQLIEHYGFDMYELARCEGIGWVAAQTQISYFSPALLMEEVIIQTSLMGFTEKSLQIEGMMWNSDKTILKALLWSKLVHFNLTTQQSQRHADTLVQLFQKIVYPPPANSFESRIKSLKQLA